MYRLRAGNKLIVEPCRSWKRKTQYSGSYGRNRLEVQKYKLVEPRECPDDFHLASVVVVIVSWFKLYSNPFHVFIHGAALVPWARGYIIVRGAATFDDDHVHKQFQRLAYKRRR